MIRPDSQVISAKLADVLVNEIGVIVRLVWKSALWVDIDASNDIDALSNKTMGKAANAAKEVDARDHICAPDLWAAIRADEEAFVTVFLE